MIKQIDVMFNGWGDYWHWGSLRSVQIDAAIPKIVFEYSQTALEKGFELSSHTLPLRAGLYKNFPQHQLGLPGPVYDSLPDGWGMLIMDRLFKQRGLNPARIGPLERLAHIGPTAMGALTFVPSASEEYPLDEITLDKLAQDVNAVLTNEEMDDAVILQRLNRLGGSPQGARPKALVFVSRETGVLTTAPGDNSDAWLVKFPAEREHPEVCAIEYIYAECLRHCDIPVSETRYYPLPNRQAAFATKRFDRQGVLRKPMQSLASFTGADYRAPGSLDYASFLRATFLCTKDYREVVEAYKRAVFNVVFNNRDDHTKNFSFLMNKLGDWCLSPAFDVTFCEGPGGYHQMDIEGEALNITGQQLINLGVKEAKLPKDEAALIINKMCTIASQFKSIAEELLPGAIRNATLNTIQDAINRNIKLISDFG